MYHKHNLFPRAAAAMLLGLATTALASDFEMPLSSPDLGIVGSRMLPRQGATGINLQVRRCAPNVRSQLNLTTEG